jgi:heat shock protein HtpX
MNGMKTTLLLVGLTLLFVWIGYALGGQRGVMIAFAFAMLMNFVSYWFSDKIVLKMYGARQVDESTAPELVGAVRTVATAAGIPMPKVYIIPKDTPNAFATGRNPQNSAVAATEGILRLLTRDELEGVMAHEVAHIKHRDTLISTIAATLASAIGMLAYMARWGAIFGGYGGRDDRNNSGGVIGLLVMTIVAPLAATLIQLAISRSREYLADEGGARFSHKPWALASALEKLHNINQQRPMGAQPATAHLFIVNPLSARGLASLFSTHPPVEERIARLRAIRAF